MSAVVTRFAPSPTGPLHLGHAYAAWLAHDMARAAGGRFLLRIEDIDRSRARADWEALIFEDLRWLGLPWEEPVMRQADRLPAYAAALDRLWAAGLLYPCSCTRRDIAAALSAPQEGDPPLGPDGPVYPGTCRPPADAPMPATRPAGATLRLNMAQALPHLGRDPLSWTETGIQAARDAAGCSFGRLLAEVGDIVLARQGMGASYHLAVTLDDAEQRVSHVTRGADLAPATAIHAALQRLLGLPSPVYHHHRLIRDAAGKRLAKRDDARAIRTWRDAGHSPQDLRRMVGLSPLRAP